MIPKTKTDIANHLVIGRSHLDPRNKRPFRYSVYTFLGRRYLNIEIRNAPTGFDVVRGSRELQKPLGASLYYLNAPYLEPSGSCFKRTMMRRNADSYIDDVA